MATLGFMKSFAVLLLMALMAVALAVGAPAQARTRSCGTVAAPGYHAFNTKARGLRCSKARSIVKKWLDAKAEPSTGPRGWKCHRSVVEPWSCRHDRQRIYFIFHSY